MLNYILRCFSHCKRYSLAFNTESDYFDNFGKAVSFTKKWVFMKNGKDL